jgi:hypothetical protein
MYSRKPGTTSGVGTTSGRVGAGSAVGTLYGTSALLVLAPERPIGGGGIEEDELLLAVALAVPDDELWSPLEHEPR